VANCHSCKLSSWRIVKWYFVRWQIVRWRVVRWWIVKAPKIFLNRVAKQEYFAAGLPSQNSLYKKITFWLEVIQQVVLNRVALGSIQSEIQYPVAVSSRMRYQISLAGIPVLLVMDHRILKNRYPLSSLTGYNARYLVSVSVASLVPRQADISSPTNS